jgi:hypothetical protein
VPIFLEVNRQLDQLLIDSVYTIGKSFFLLLECVPKALQLRTSNLLIQQVYFLIEIFSDIDERLKHGVVSWFCFHEMLAMKAGIINSKIDNGFGMATMPRMTFFTGTRTAIPFPFLWSTFSLLQTIYHSHKD